MLKGEIIFCTYIDTWGSIISGLGKRKASALTNAGFGNFLSKNISGRRKINIEGSTLTFFAIGCDGSLMVLCYLFTYS